MKGGFNKILRNIVAGSSDTEYEKVSCWPVVLRLRFADHMCSLAIEIDKSYVPSGLKGTQGEARYL